MVEFMFLLILQVGHLRTHYVHHVLFCSSSRNGSLWHLMIDGKSHVTIYTGTVIAIFDSSFNIVPHSFLY